MKKLKKVETEQEKFLNKIFHFTFCYQPGMERQEFEIYFKHIPILIEENGKVRQVPMDSLRSEPEAIKKAKIVFDPSKVPEKDRSAALAISLPMPDKSSIINMFHDGSFYVYKRKDGKPIEDSIIQRIIEGQDIPISTGETFMGAWNQDTGDSRGSASFKELTAMAQDANQPDDPTKPLIFESTFLSF